MQTRIITSILGAFLMAMPSFAQDKTTVRANSSDISDNLDLRVVASIFGVLAYWFRAIRWNLLLEPMGYQISNSNSFWTISFGYLMMMQKAY